MNETMTCIFCDKPLSKQNLLDEVDTCDSCMEKAYDRQQERLMENGPGPTLLEQQQAAYKIKRGLR